MNKSNPVSEQVPKPSGIWRWSQALKGMNWSHLSIPQANLRGKWVLITGGNNGVGFEAALQFAKWGANIILACRAKVPDHEQTPDHAIESLRAASGSEASIIECFRKARVETGRALDILCNDVGMMPNSRKVSYTEEGFEIVHQVNFLSHVLLTLVLLPSLAKSLDARIICTTSNMHFLGTFDFTLSNANSGAHAYSNNKLYFQTWLTQLQHRLSHTLGYEHIHVFGAHPGYVKTGIWINPSSASKKATTSWFGWLLYMLLDWVAIDAQQGSLAIVNAATFVEQGNEKGDSLFFNRIWKQEAMPQTTDEACRRVVWEFVMGELGERMQDLSAVKELDA